jgi:hypothetical protein
MIPNDPSSLLMTVNLTFNVPLLAVVVGVVLTLLAYAGVLRYRRRRLERRRRDIAAHVVEYFRQYRLEVAAQCFALFGGRRFVVVVESPPVKRFRYSHIIESSLIQHLQKTAGAEVDKIYWRFPLAWQGGPEDPYFAKGQNLLEKAHGEYRVEEASWESYQSSRADTSGDKP